jgi:hypothetical protein
LRRLGLDADILKPATSGNTDPAMAMRLDIEKSMAELDLDEKQVAKILAVLDQHADFDKLDDSDPNAERARALAGDDEKLEKFRALLREAGLSDADIDEACRLATNGGGGAKDRLPLDATHGGFGGRFADRRPAMDESARASLETKLDRKFGIGRVAGEQVRQAADRRTVMGLSRAAVERISARFPGFERIGHV